LTVSLDIKHSLVDYLVFFIFLSLPLSNRGSSISSRCSSISTGISSRGSSISSRGSSIAEGRDMSGSNSGSSSGITNMLNRPLDTDSLVGDSVDWSVDGSDNLLGRVSGVGGVVDVGSLNNLLDRVDLVGSSHRDSTGDSDIVGSSDVLVDNDLTGNRCWHMDRDINIVFLHIDLGNDVGGLGGDSDMRPHRGEDPLLGDGVSRGRSKVPGCRGDGSKGCWGNGEHWGSNGHGDSRVLDDSSNIGGSGLGKVLDSSNSELVSGNNTLDSSLDNLMTDNSVLSVLLDCGGSCSVGLVSLSYHSRGRHHGGTSIRASSGINSSGGTSHGSGGVHSSLGGGGSHSDSHKGE